MAKRVKLMTIAAVVWVEMKKPYMAGWATSVGNFISKLIAW